MAPLPRLGEKECPRCGGPQSVAYTAFECPSLRAQRGDAVKSLDEACSGAGVQKNHRWWGLSATQKLRATFCPTKGTVPPPSEGAFFSKASKVWKDFYVAAEEATTA